MGVPSPKILCVSNSLRGGVAISVVNYFSIALDDPADGEGLFADALQYGLRFLEFCRGDDQQHAQAHVEGAQHLVLRNVAQLLQVLEQGQHRPGAEFDDGCGSPRQHARQILSDAAAGNVGQRGNASRIDQLFQRRPVTLVGAHQLITDFILDLVDVGFRRVAGHFEEQFAGQRISVGVQAIGGHAENDVADLHVFAGDDVLAFDHAHNKARQVVLAVGIEAWHLGGLAADQRAAVVFAGIGNAFNHFLGDLGLQLAGGEIVHEEQRSGALDGDVIDAMIDQVGSDGGVQPHFEGNLQLRSHAIDAGDQDGIQVLGLVDDEEATKAANFAEHTAGKGFVRQILDALLGAVGAVDIDTGVGVGNSVGGRGMLSHGLLRRLFLGTALGTLLGSTLGASLNTSVWGNGASGNGSF